MITFDRYVQRSTTCFRKYPNRETRLDPFPQSAALVPPQVGPLDRLHILAQIPQYAVSSRADQFVCRFDLRRIAPTVLTQHVPDCRRDRLHMLSGTRFEEHGQLRVLSQVANRRNIRFPVAGIRDGHV